MQIPLLFFLIIFILLIVIAISSAGATLYHIMRFGQNDAISIATAVVFSLVFLLILIAAIFFLTRINWSGSLDLLGTSLSPFSAPSSASDFSL